MPASTPSRPRRGLLVGGASAVLGAAAVALGQGRAEAATSRPLLVGRGNTAGAATTSLTAATAGAARAALALVQRGAGLGLTVSSSATAVVGAAAGGSAWGVWGRSTATRAGTGGGVRAEGRKNAGLLADTTARDVPAVVAIGGDGTGVAQVATGQSYLDGDALALRAWTGVLAPDGTHIAYAPLVSAESAAHVTAGTAVLDGSGALTVTLPATFTEACDTSTLAVTLTPLGAAMPGLFASYQATSGGYDAFTISGGASGGNVAWTAWATRRAVDLKGTGSASLAPAQAAGPNASSPATPQAQSGPTSNAASPDAPGGQPGGASPSASDASRLSRPSLRLPAR